MGASVIPETTMMEDLLKPTGFDCPESMIGKTFAEVMGSATLYAWKSESDAHCYTLSGTPEVGDKVYAGTDTGLLESATIAEVDTGTITVSSTEFARYTTGDISL